MGSGFGMLIFWIVAIIIGFTIVKNFAEWSSNNNSPILTVNAKIVTKRAKLNRHNHMHNNMSHSTFTATHFATFEVEDGSRMELQVKNKEYGLLADGDVGELTFQGTRYISFERDKI